MDLKLSAERATDEVRDAVDAVLGTPIAGWDGGVRDAGDHRVARAGHGVHGERTHLLAALHAVQDRQGWIDPGAINYIAQRMDVAPAEIYGVASFYALFSLRERPAHQVHVCVDLACKMAGSDDASVPEGAHPSPCLGLCERAPAALVTEAGATPRQTVIAPFTSVSLRSAVDGVWPADEAPIADGVPQVGEESLTLLRRVGKIDPASLDSYRGHGGYAALRQAFDLGPVGVIREVLDAKLVGRGGAAFPAGRKWDAVAHQPARPHHLVCNADESEPGTFKDRVLMEGDPFALIEAMTIAAYATGCEHGWIYLRGEYPRAMRNLQNAIEVARRRGFLGENILDSGFSFDLEIFRGAGAYICGEETAIFNSIEGFRGEPRNKPPFPVEVGVFGKPTVVNNVETLVNVLPILLAGGPVYASVGTEGSVGPKLFCVSGGVSRPGVYEVPFGATLRELIDLCGGVPEGRQLQAVLLGGAAGAFVGPSEIDVPLTFEGTRAIGATLGSGVVMVLDDTVELVPFLLRIAAFFRDESCGQCVPCRVGTVRQEEALARLASGIRGGEMPLLAEIGRVMKDASICGLGQTAHNAIESAFVKLGVFK